MELRVEFEQGSGSNPMMEMMMKVWTVWVVVCLCGCETRGSVRPRSGMPERMDPSTIHPQQSEQLTDASRVMTHE